MNNKSGEAMILLMIILSIPILLSIRSDFKMVRAQQAQALKIQMTNNVEKVNGN